MELGGRGWADAHWGLSYNGHIHYLVVKRDDVPCQLVMFTRLAGLCVPPLQIVCLACKYFKLPIN